MLQRTTSRFAMLFRRATVYAIIIADYHFRD